MSLPRYEPMLAVRWENSFTHPNWVFELKWDGVRAIATADEATVTLRSRRGRDITATYPELTNIVDGPVVLDGEIVAFDENGRPSFDLLQRRMNLDIAGEAVKAVPVVFVVFDLLHDGNDRTGEPLERRREILAGLELRNPAVAGEIEDDGEALFEAVVEQGLEGVVAKKRGSKYRPGVRSPEWRKINHYRSVRAVVGGFTAGEGGRSATFGSLVLGLWDGDRLRWIGSVGTGFDEASLRAIREALGQMSVDESPFHPHDELPEATWVEPSLVAHVSYKSWTTAGNLRHPAFKGLGDDQPPLWSEEGPEAEG